MPTPINTYKIEEIKQFLKKNRPKKPWWLKTYPVNGKAEGSLDISSIKISFDLGKMFSSWTLNSRIEFAVWEWLNPNYSFDDLDRLKEELQFESLEKVAFYKKVETFCSKIPNEKEELSIWVNRRLALLEYRISPPTELPSELTEIASQINIFLMGASTVLKDRPEFTHQEAKRQLNESLKHIGNIVSRIICKHYEDCQYRVNLMLPMPEGNLARKFFQNSIAQNNIAQASQLWGDTPPSKEILAVVAETGDTDEFLGFWMPFYSNQGKHWAGASTAYCQAHGSAVFADDLPPIDGVMEPVVNRWNTYVKNNFNQGFFVSLPFRIDLDGQGRKAYAVFNININPVREDGRRAYHAEWLKIVQKLTSSLMTEAYKAFMLWAYTNGDSDDSQKLDFGDRISSLNSFAGIKPQFLLKGNNSNEPS